MVAFVFSLASLLLCSRLSAAQGSARTACDASALRPAPSKLRCSAQGHLSAPQPLETATSASYLACAGKCAADPSCISFGFRGKQCVLYSASLDKQGLQIAAQGNPTTFGNHRCFSTTCSTLSTITSFCANPAASSCTASASAVPACAQSCYTEGAEAAGCNTADYACQCSRSSAVFSVAASCIVNGCPASEFGPAQSSEAALCSCVTQNPASTSCGLSTTTIRTTASTITTSCANPAASSCTASAEAIPPCAQSCYESAASAVGCAQTDFACQCSRSAALESQALSCYGGACPASEFAPIAASESALCACATQNPDSTSCSVVTTVTG